MKATKLSQGFLKALLPGLVMISGLLLSQTAGAAANDLDGSPHDFVGLAWATSNEGQLCVFCHAPHNALNPDDGPLWNHGTTAASYSMYAENTVPPGSDLQATVATSVDGVSKMCLSCHDGTIALDNYGGKATAGTTFISGNANLGDTLSDDHPIGIIWPSGDNEIEAVATVRTTLPLFGASSNTLECATCHDVHNTGDIHASNGSLLRVSKANSLICTTCHLK